MMKCSTLSAFLITTTRNCDVRWQKKGIPVPGSLFECMNKYVVLSVKPSEMFVLPSLLFNFQVLRKQQKFLVGCQMIWKKICYFFFSWVANYKRFTFGWLQAIFCLLRWVVAKKVDIIILDTLVNVLLTAKDLFIFLHT